MQNNPKSRQRVNLFLLLGLVGAALLLIFLAASGGKQAVSAAPEGAQSADGLWQDVDEATLRVEGDRVIVPTAYRTVSLDWEAINTLLAQAPASMNSSEIILSLPLPDGSYGRFQISKTAVMHPDLAAKFPEIQTFVGKGLDDATAYARLDSTPKGFHAMILSGNGRVFIDPYTDNSVALYQSYFASDFIPNLPEDFEPDVVVEEPGSDIHAADAPGIDGVFTSGGQLRTYRLAVAATGEYTQFHGGTVPLALAEIVTAINRVAGIYEREVAVTFQLVANNDQIIYTNGATDPYTNTNGAVMLGQNQSNLNAVIGSANYDVGHVFSTGGGGIAGLGVVCGGAKAQGVTGLGSPIGDPFYVDYVSHEMGHQFAGNHTFNGSTGSCAGGNRNGSTAYEPGSGTTIMAYAGICSPQDIQSNSDDYFHGISFDEIVSFTTAGNGNTCAAVSSTSNTPPTANAGASFSIPLNTPFTLTGSGSDVDGTASLTYNWEEFDLGPTGSPLSPSGNAPIFRSFGPTGSPSRTFPQISDIVNNTQTLGELLPTYGRTMNFRFTVRDNQVPAGGVASDETTVTAVTGTGPFLVTAPNTVVTWVGNTVETVTWNVAGTNLAPISCANVAISLSSDGGFTYNTVLDASTPNDGSADVLVPNIGSSSARVRVSCADNIFFDISNSNFTVVPGGGPTVTPSNTPVPPTATNTPLPPTPTGTASNTPTPGPGGQTLQFNPVADAFTMSNRPTSNLGVASTLRLDASPETNSYLRFDVQGLNGTVSQATLRVYVQSSSTPGYDVHQLADNSWGETSINFSNAPAFGSLIGSSGSTTANNYVDVDVTSAVSANGLVSFGLSTADSGLILLASRESGNQPELIVQTAGSGGPTATPTATNTAVPPTPTNTPVGPTPTATNTAVPPTPTNTPTATATSGPGGSSFTFNSVDDAILLGNRPTSNYGTATILGTDDAPNILSFLKFDVAGLDGAVASATLRLFVSSGNAAFDTVEITDNSWSQNSITYSNAPAAGTLINSSGTVVTGTWVEIDVTSYISGDGTFSLALLPDAAGRNLFDSAETGNGPELVVVTGP
ncbi:MAG: DNRLRE domain-containing protein [Ardenticatenaceae bacterium]|nr:DNRLRE domain-containing protein [Ardenticatenaceae bacterium]